MSAADDQPEPDRPHIEVDPARVEIFAPKDDLDDARTLIDVVTWELCSGPVKRETITLAEIVEEAETRALHDSMDGFTTHLIADLPRIASEMFDAGDLAESAGMVLVLRD